uniref:Protein KRI1 homolog n=1 Tax=Ciona savignyi TaxID=51511 RepID=H2YGX2_CIOSA
MDELRINHEFAKKYDKYRKAEEMQRLKDRYGNADALESSSSESEDEMAEAINPRLEKDFFNTLAILKRKDKEIYDKDKNFFKESPEHLSDNDSSDSGVHENRKTEKPFLLRDYERKVVLEKAGCYEDEGEDHTVGSYSHELNEIKRELKQATMEKDGKQSDEEADDFLTKKSQSSIVDTKVELVELDEYWTKPDLSKDEKFLRDYILDRKYLDTNELELDGDYDNQDEDEEDMFVSKQENFEHKFNFRYQEPDSEFIKSYPRTIANSVRKTNDKTKIKRESRKTRKEEEKRKK